MSKARIKIKFFAVTAIEVGAKEKILTVSKDLNEALKEIEKIINWPLKSNLEKNRICLMLNGRAVKMPIEKRALVDGDVMALIPIMGGG
ncbi:MAG: hypothetical protein APF76_08960 [Desulfitibacter sp. BRH_c19]|nr:MAG: hypothetical protein APF76_08960 [Desulfitibacter sp. BRH_c19]